MSDSDLLARARSEFESGPGDPWARWRFRVECVRAGRAELAGLEPGDVVMVEEVESPWVRNGGPWRGVVTQHNVGGDGYVRPLDLLGMDESRPAAPLPADSPWHVRPSNDYLRKGLYLTREDKKTLLEPARPDAALPSSPDMS